MKRNINTPFWVNGRTIYEVNIRQYTREGTFKAFQSHLPRLKDLGIGILWLMPVQPIGIKNRKGSLGSYYSVNNYTSINPEFGTLEDFKALVKAAHELDMKVLIDWVANHTAWDHHWTIDHPDFFSLDENGDFKAPVPEWEDVIHLDYGNPKLWDAMIDAMKYWLIETGIDGFRCDMAHLVPTPFWNRARHDLDKVLPIYMLAESQNHDLLEYAFDTIYNWKLLHAMDDVAAGKTTASALLDLHLNEKKYLPPGASELNFTSNHDENSWQGSSIERLHYYLEPLTVLSFFLPGIPLIYSGQEAGNYRRLEFFDKDEIEWKTDKMFALYQRLVGIHSDLYEYPSHTNFTKIENDASDSIMSIGLSNDKDQYVVLLNLSDKDTKFYLKCSNINGYWMDLVKNEKVEFNCHNQQQIAAFSYIILRKIS